MKTGYKKLMDLQQQQIKLRSKGRYIDDIDATSFYHTNKVEVLNFFYTISAVMYSYH